MRCDPRIPIKTRQSGAVLAIALIFLVVLTLLGITGAQNTVLEERMTGNYRDRQIAFEAAEAALRTAENSLLPPVPIATFQALTWNGTNGRHEGNPSLDPDDANNPVTVSITEISAATSADPTYYIERLPEMDLPKSDLGLPKTVPKIRYYRSTAKGWGQSQSTDPLVVLQSTLYR